MRYLLVIPAILLLSACGGEPVKPPPPEPVPVIAPKPTNNLFAPWLEVRDRDVADARVFDEMIRKQGLPIAAEVVRAVQTNYEGRNLTVEIWRGSNMGLPPALLSKRTPSVQRSVELVGEFAANRGAQARISVFVSEADKPVVRKWLETGMAKGRGRFPTELQWKALKKGDLPFVRIEPADIQYASGPYTK